MSIVRWGEHGSSVYIIGADAGWECVGCRDGMSDDQIFEHVAWHRLRGDTVPGFVEARLYGAPDAYWTRERDARRNAR